MSRRVLIVDDNAELREMFRDMLQAQGYATVAAATVAEAEALLKAGVDLIVLDYFIAGFSGGKFFERLRADAATRGIPVLICSGSADAVTMQDLVDRGAAGYFRKPFKTDLFIAKVKSLLP